MVSFFLDKFEFDLQSNRRWIEAIDEADLTQESAIRRLMCHILNVHHIWNARLHNRQADSSLWDDLPFQHWMDFAEENYRTTCSYIEYDAIGSSIAYTSTEGEQLAKTDGDILYHLLLHSDYHRAQIAQLMRQAGKEPPKLYFINFH